MSDPSTIAAIGGSNASSGATSSSAASSSNSLSQLDNPQVFLQLLVAELQNQDPTNPTDPSTIMSQTSELAQMQAVNTMTTAIGGEQTASQVGEATGLIGRSITATVNGTALTGAVSAVQLDSSGHPSLVVNQTTVPLASVTSVQ